MRRSYLVKEEEQLVDEAVRCARRKHTWKQYVSELNVCLERFLFYMKASNK